MRKILIALALLIAAPASAQTIIPGDTKLSIVFYVKEGTASPYQGRLEFTQQEYAKLKPADIAKLQLAQHAAWKAATEAARNVVVKERSAEEMLAEIEALEAQASEIVSQVYKMRSDPAFVSKVLEKK